MSAVFTTGSVPLALTDRFELLQSVGYGTFGTVTCARIRASGISLSKNILELPYLKPNAVVAIKSMNLSLSDPAHYLKVREVKFLRSIPPHENLVEAYEIFLNLFDNQLHIIMECLQMNLHQYISALRRAIFDDCHLWHALSNIKRYTPYPLTRLSPS